MKNDDAKSAVEFTENFLGDDDMEKEAKQAGEGFKKLERATEVTDMEGMHGATHGQALVNAAEEETLDNEITKTRKTVMRSTVIAVSLWLVFAVLLIVRLLGVF